MALKHIETSFDPLNLVFKAKTIAAFFGWLLLTILSTLALIGAIAFLVFKYERMQTIAVVELKPTTGPFPAVTLCNINPYKSSVVASSMPDLQYLIDAHEKAITDRRPAASPEKSITSRGPIDSNEQAPPFDQDDAKTKSTTKAERRARQKRAVNQCDPNVCDETSLQRFQMPNSTYEFTYFPIIRTTWECAFECCQEKDGRQMARIVGDEAYKFLNASGFLQKKLWIPVYCSDGCHWRSSPTRNLDKLHNWSVDICARPTCLAIAGDPHTKTAGYPISASSDGNSIFITVDSISTTAAVLCQEEPVNMTSSTNSPTSHAEPTSGSKEAHPNSTSTSMAMNVNGSADGTAATIDPCQCNFDDARTTSIPSNSSSSVAVVLFPKMNTTWSCAFECCQRKPGLKMARVQGDEAYKVLNASGFLQKKIWFPIYCHEQVGYSRAPCYWHLSLTTKLDRVAYNNSWTHICRAPLCGPTIAESDYAIDTVFSVVGQAKMITITYEPIANTAAVLCEKETLISSSTVAITWKTESSKEAGDEFAASMVNSRSEAATTESRNVGQEATKPSDINKGTVELVSPSNDLKIRQAEPTRISPLPSFQVAQAEFKEAVDKILNDPEISSDPQAVTSTTQDLVPYVVSSETPSDLERMGYTSSEIIFRCTYNRRQCSHNNFTLQADPTYGNCYTFNSDGRNPVSNRPGQGGGLTVAYRVDQSDYLSFVPTYGLKIVLHAQGDPVFPDSSGLSVSSGRYTSIVLKQVRIKQMTIGNKACISDKRKTPFYYYNDTNYATEACIKSCQQASIISTCFCGDPRLPLPPEATYANCNVTARACVNAWHKDNGDTKCDCPQACENEIYESTSTAGLLIGPVSEKNLALIEIYFGSLTTVQYVEQMKYQLFDLLWDISSAIGLFSGMSVLSVFELIQICKGGQQSDDDDESEEE